MRSKNQCPENGLATGVTHWRTAEYLIIIMTIDSTKFSFSFQIMPSLKSLLNAVIVFLAIFPISRLQIRTQTNANSRFVQWMNGLFYLPRGNELRVRKEYRLLSDEERRNYHQAILLLKNDRVHTLCIYHTMYIILYIWLLNIHNLIR
jgi:hypothetical protein